MAQKLSDTRGNMPKGGSQANLSTLCVV